MLVTASHKEGKIDQVESELIGNVFDFADRLAREIMIPRQNIVCPVFGRYDEPAHRDDTPRPAIRRYPCAKKTMIIFS
mgnify:CR=1 FL=1